METRVIKRTVLADGEPEDRISSIKHYQVYRGLSPTTSNRYEIRIRELEDALEAERDLRLRAERGFTELSIEAGGLSDKLDEVDGLTAAQLEALRRRDQEILKLRKELELLQIQAATNESGLKKRHSEAIALLTAQLEAANKIRNKGDKDKQQLNIEIDLLATQADTANKGRAHAESKLDSLEDQLRRLRAQNEELIRVNADLTAIKNKQGQEIQDLQKQLHDLDVSYNHLLKLKAQLLAQLEETKAKLEDESRLRAQLASQLHSLQADFDSLNARYEEELANSGSLKSQLQKALGDLHLLKNKYESDLTHRSTELEDIRRRSGARILELEELFEQSRNRAAGLEKDKVKLQIEIRDYTSQLESVNAANLDLGKRLKGFEGSSFDLQKRVDELTLELGNLNSDHQKDLLELARLKALVTELTDKNDHLGRENKHLTDNLKDALANVNELTRQVQELSILRSQLLAERDALSVELAETKEALRDALAKLDAATQALQQLKSDLERRLKEKEEELDRVRRGGQKAIDDLQKALLETEVRFKNELSRLKKKYDTDIREFELQLEALSRANAELLRNNKALSTRVKELEVLLEEERRALEEAKQAANIWERRFIALQGEFDTLQAQFELVEKARLALETQCGDSSGRLNELNITITGLTSEKRRFESECHSLRVELDGLLGAKKVAEERVEKLQIDIARLMEELKTEQEAVRRGDAGKKQLEAEIKDLRIKLEELEAVGGREAKAVISRLEIRLREVEHELEAERRRSRDLLAENKKLQRLYQEIKSLHDEKQRKIVELTDKVEQLTSKNKQLRRQIEEVEEVVGITIGKYRKGQQQVEEAQRRADNVERNAAISRLSPLRVVAPVITPVVARGLSVGVGPHHHHHHTLRASSVAPLTTSLHPIGNRSLSVAREVRRVGRY